MNFKWYIEDICNKPWVPAIRNHRNLKDQEIEDGDRNSGSGLDHHAPKRPKNKCQELRKIMYY